MGQKGTKGGWIQYLGVVFCEWLNVLRAEAGNEIGWVMKGWKLVCQECLLTVGRVGDFGFGAVSLFYSAVLWGGHEGLCYLW